MSELIAYGRQIQSVFQLLGEKENDMTMSMAWVMHKCPAFLRAIALKTTGVSIEPEDTTIVCQNYIPKQEGSAIAITDIEIDDGKSMHIVIEAKRGWVLPSAAQLEKYAKKLSRSSKNGKTVRIVTMSECSEEYAVSHLPFMQMYGIEIVHLPWKDVYAAALAAKDASDHEQKRLLKEFCHYMSGLINVQKAESNLVYVVSLSYAKPDGCQLSWLQIVQKYHKYFCPVGGNGWPKEPPNYIAFRYDGKLQSIHHIESYVVTDRMHTQIPDMPDEKWDTDHFVYTLGPAIVPQKTVKTGKIYRSGRVWAMLDTLLTCDTISEARDLTQNRLRKESE